MGNELIESRGQKRKREYGIDVMRIFAMLLVIMGHVTGQGGIIDATYGNAEHYCALFIFVFSLCSINIFGLISGYVGYERKIRWFALLMLWLKIVFWTCSISFVFVLAGQEKIDSNLLRITFLPIVSKSYWYMTGYFIVVILSPMLNMLVHRINTKIITTLLIITTIGLSVVVTTSGNNALWLILLYVWGAIIKKSDVLKRKKVSIGVIGYILCILATFIVSVFYLDGSLLINKHIWAVFGGRENGLWPSALTMVFAAIFAMLIGINLKLNERFIKIVRFVTPLVLSVYLIHVQPLVFKRMSNSMIWLTGHGVLIELAGIILVSLSIFILCLFLEYWRERIFEIISAIFSK